MGAFPFDDPLCPAGGIALNTPDSSSLIDPTFLFRFEVPLHRRSCDWSSSGLELPPDTRVASFAVLSGQTRFAEVRMAWEAGGIGFVVDVAGKRSQPWCRSSRPEDSDGFHLWVDSRCSPGIHRATQYCHRFLFMPSGGGSDLSRPLAGILPINRARQNPKPPPAGSIRVFSDVGPEGYRLSGRIAAAAITGFDPSQFSKIGLFFAVIDRELGWQTLCLSQAYPVAEDPSLWAEAVLAE